MARILRAKLIVQLLKRDMSRRPIVKTWSSGEIETGKFLLLSISTYHPPHPSLYSRYAHDVSRWHQAATQRLARSAHAAVQGVRFTAKPRIWTFVLFTGRERHDHTEEQGKIPAWR